MLEALRKRTGGWVARVLIALLVISFAVWGVPGILDRGSGQTVARIGDTEITTAEFAAAYQNEIQAIAQQYGISLTAAQAAQAGIPDQVLAGLARDATLDAQVDSLGLNLSDERMASVISSQPGFNATLFRQNLAAAGFTERSYIDSQRVAELRQQVASAMVEGVALPDAYLRVLSDLQSETRAIRYATLGPDAVEAAVEPTDEELAAYFEANAAAWFAPETRAVTVLAVSPEGLSDPAAVTEAEALASYERRRAEFSTAETRRVQQVLFPSQARADEVAVLIAGGRTFEDLAAAGEITPTDLGTVARTAIFDPAVAEAAFSLEEGGTSAVVQGRTAPVIVHVIAVNPPVVTPFEEVRDIVVADLAADIAADQIDDIREQVEDSLSGGDSVAQAGERLALPVVIVPAVDANGNDLDGNPANLPGGQNLLTAIFESDVGLSNSAIQLSRDSYIWYEVTAVTPSHQRELAEVRDEVVAAWREDTNADRLSILAASVAARLAAGESFEDIAVAEGVAIRVATAGGLVRGQPVEGLSADAVDAAFGGPVDYVTVADAADGAGLVVLRVTNIAVAAYEPGGDAPAAAATLRDELENNLFTAYIGDIQTRIGTEVNPAAILNAIGLSSQ